MLPSLFVVVPFVCSFVVVPFVCSFVVVVVVVVVSACPAAVGLVAAVSDTTPYWVAVLINFFNFSYAPSQEQKWNRSPAATATTPIAKRRLRTQQ